MIRSLSTDEVAALGVDTTLERLGSSREGLSGDEETSRLDRLGPNEVSDRRRSAVVEFLARFWGPIAWMIEAAFVLSVVVGRWEDALIIGVLLVMNGVVGFWEEHQAGNAIAALKQRLASTARVRRDGTWVVLPARVLVPGDVIRVRLGDVVPADACLLDDVEVEVDQSALTGESLPVSRTGGDSLFAGSTVSRGETDAVVTATGHDTYFGRTTRLVAEASTVSHFQRAVLRIGNFLILLAAVLVSLIVVVSLARGAPAATTLEFALVVTVAAVPVALPAVLSVTMAVGARTLAHEQAIVSHLPAVEELGGMDVLCCDKTGTLTENRLKLVADWSVDGVNRDEVLLCAALASREEDRDPIDLAVLSATPAHEGARGYRVTDFLPFDPVHKRTEAGVDGPDGSFRVSKGAPQVILALVETGGLDLQAKAMGTVEEFARRGARSLGVARTDEHSRWRFLGVVALEDPPRDDSRATIAEATRLGVDVRMVTGDQLAIARQIATEVGLGAEILDAETLTDDDTERLSDLIEGADGFAQVFPEHKYHIVQSLQHRGHIVGMTGDGVNDAPALKQADAGIAVSGATDAARAAADVVLLAPGLSVIVTAIRTAREIFQRMTTYAIYRIAETIRVLLLITLSILIFDFFPVTPVMIVLLALLNDGAILSIAYDRAEGSERPEAWDMTTVLSIATALGVIGVVASFALVVSADKVFALDRPTIQTLLYLKLSVAGHLTIFLTRTRGPFWTRPHPARIVLIAVIGTQTIATLVAVYGILVTPIGWEKAALVWVYALAWFFVNDRIKLAVYRGLARRRASATVASNETGAVPA